MKDTVFVNTKLWVGDKALILATLLVAWVQTWSNSTIN